MALLPFLALFLNFAFWRFKFDKKDKTTKILLSTFVILDILLPSLMNSMIELITCREIDGEYYLRKDTSYMCYTTEHLFDVNN